jgi:hypothetical protein
MTEDFFVDFSRISLSAFEKELAQTELLPSREVLHEDLHIRFERLRGLGLVTLADLLAELKSSQKMKDLSRKSGLDEEYLAILRREVNNCQPKAVNLFEFPGIPAEAVQKLAQHGIRSTPQLFAFIQTPADRAALAAQTGVDEAVILELTHLTDVSRIRWVGANFARLLVDAGCDTVSKVARADYAPLYRQLMQINEEQQYFKGKFGENDMRLTVLLAQKVPQVIVY